MIKTRIIDGDGSGLEAHVHRFSTAKRDNHSGLLSLTRSFLNFNPEFHPFLNDTFGTAMNQSIAFSGTPELIFDGGSGGTEWAGTAVQGSWNFADGGKVTITSANNNDESLFQDSGGGSTDMSGFTALTGKVDLDTYNSVDNSILIQFALAGVVVGNSVDLNDFIDTGNFAEQNFVVPKADMGLTTQTVDDFEILIVRTGGPKPTVKFDDFQLEETGDPAVFKATTPEGTRFHITEIRIRVTDDLDTTLANGTVPNFNPDNILGVSALSNGIAFSRVQNGETLFSVILRSLDDFLATGSDLINDPGNATKAGFTLLVTFPEPIVLEGGSGNFLSFTINDDLSALTRFTAAARGALEI